MISTKPKEQVNNIEELFQQYVKLEPDDRGKFMSKIINWLTKRVDEDNKKRAEQLNKQ